MKPTATARQFAGKFPHDEDAPKGARLGSPTDLGIIVPEHAWFSHPTIHLQKGKPG